MTTGQGSGSVRGETDDHGRQAIVGPLVRTWWQRGWLWPCLLSLVPVALVIAGYNMGWEWIGGGSSKYTYEVVAVPLTALAAALFAVRAVVTRHRLFVLLAVQAAVFCCREIHFTGTHKGVYVATAVVAAWALIWAMKYREGLRPENVDWRQASFLVAAVVTYALAIVIQKRVFKFVPGEPGVHVPLEEATESMAHLLLVLSAVIGRWRRSAPHA
jgi:hypothetical protein